MQSYHNDKWPIATGMTLTISSLSLTVSSFALCPHLSLFSQMWQSSKQPLSGSLICSRGLTKNRGTKIIWTKRRDALGFGLQPRCQRAKITDSLHHFHFFFVHCISWGQSGRAKLVCESLRTQNYTSIRKQTPKVKQKGIG